MGIKLISFKELTEIFEKELPDDNYKVAADFLLKAVTDWPTKDLVEPDEIITELKREIDEALTYDNLIKYLNTPSPTKDPWKVESINALLELFDFDRNNNYNLFIDLEEITEQLTKHFRNKSNC